MSNLSPELRIEHFTSPSLDFADLAQPIGFYAWRNRLANRTEQEIDMVFARFGISRQRNANQLLGVMENKARIGKFAGAVALEGSREVGYAWAADDMSGNKVKRFIKRAKSCKPYAWLAQINVLPEFQRQGIGTSLLEEVLGSFEPDQKPTAYVFNENQLALDWFKRLGFVPKPDEPTPRTIYFGDIVKPVQQWRLEAPSVNHVLDAASCP